MVQVTFDTNNDTLPELEESLKILQAAIERRKGAPKLDMPEPRASVEEPAAEQQDAPEAAAEAADEETAVDTPFFKITVKSEDHHKEHRPEPKAEAKPKGPTLNQLLHDESLTEDELTRMFKEQLEADAKKPEPKRPQPTQQLDEGTPTYLEIIEYTDEK